MMWQWLSNSRRCCPWPAVALSATAAPPSSTSRRVRRMGSVLYFLESFAERMRGIDAKDRQLLGEERKLLECENEPAVVGMALDVRVELRGEEIALDHVAFELGHVDAVGGKAAHRLVEGSRHVLHPEHEGGDDLTCVARRPLLLARQHDETRGVVRLVLDILRQDIEAVNFGGKPGCDRPGGLVAALGDLASRTGSIGRDNRLNSELADDLAALAKRVHMALHRLD